MRIVDAIDFHSSHDLPSNWHKALIKSRQFLETNNIIFPKISRELRQSLIRLKYYVQIFN